jgi:hypothetical protein
MNRQMHDILRNRFVQWLINEPIDPCYSYLAAYIQTAEFKKMWHSGSVDLLTADYQMSVDRINKFNHLEVSFNRNFQSFRVDAPGFTTNKIETGFVYCIEIQHHRESSELEMRWFLREDGAFQKDGELEYFKRLRISKKD